MIHVHHWGCCSVLQRVAAPLPSTTISISKPHFEKIPPPAIHGAAAAAGFTPSRARLCSSCPAGARNAMLHPRSAVGPLNSTRPWGRGHDRPSRHCTMVSVLCWLPALRGVLANPRTDALVTGNGAGAVGRAPVASTSQRCGRAPPLRNGWGGWAAVRLPWTCTHPLGWVV